MPHEDVTDVAEFVAEICGIYGIGPEYGDHPDDCRCRMCFVADFVRDMEDRIREVERAERLLNEEST